jgi:CheY-like chemotaxis protein
MKDQSGSKYRKVMIIDDSSIDRFLVQTLVKKMSFAAECMSMESGELALKYLNDATQEQLPQIIFLDINMPSMTGFEFLDKYEELPDGVKSCCIIYMLSSSLDATDRSKAEHSKYVKGFLNKPLSAAALQEL